MERVDEMTSPPVVGRFYMVPCVYVDTSIARGFGRRFSADPQTIVDPYDRLLMGWWPIMGPRHEDLAHLDFAPYHWHFDPRFLSGRQMRNATMGGSNLSRIFARPLSDYGGLRGPEHRRMRCRRPLGLPSQLENLGKILEPHCADATLRGPCKVCPHRGIPLASLPVDEHGHVTCPGHGLRWDVSTGRLVRREVARVP